MRRGTATLLLIIIILAACAGYVIWPNNPGIHVLGINKDFTVNLGLDLQGGVRVLLEPQNPNQPGIADNIQAARNLIEQRVNGGLGVAEPNIRVQQNGNNYSIAVELPGLQGNQTQAIQTLLQSGTLEFWNTGSTQLQEGQAYDPTQFASLNPNGPEFTGKDLDPSQIQVSTDPQTGQLQINFAMKGNAVSKFGQFTQQNVGQFMTITLDRKVIQSAVINSAINGPGVIQGRFSLQEANSIATVLRYGALPIPLKITSQETIGPTLGADSIQKSIVAAIIGLGMVVLFMLLYYRLPGFLADCALLLYTAFTFAVFKTLGVTLTLAGIAGFVLSIGMAVDANVLIFERVKEELRAGRLLGSAIDIGWKRAWPSIRDSNISTMITCAVLYYFGNTFGATIISGFATTLFLGVAISMFTAIVVTRTFLNLLVPTGIINHPWFFGLPASAISAAPVTSGRRRAALRGVEE